MLSSLATASSSKISPHKVLIFRVPERALSEIKWNKKSYADLMFSGNAWTNDYNAFFFMQGVDNRAGYWHSLIKSANISSARTIILTTWR
jgi:hypothetical protein